MQRKIVKKFFAVILYTLYKDKPLTKEELRCLLELGNITGYYIDFSNIAEITYADLTECRQIRFAEEKCKRSAKKITSTAEEFFCENFCLCYNLKKFLEE